MIVVEGPDGAGKTTLIKHLSQELDIPIAPRVVSKEAQAMVDLKKWTEENVAGGFQRKIFDRHRLISEPIYGPVLREKLEPGFDDVVWLHEVMQAFYGLKPVIIYCLPPLLVVQSNVMGDPDNLAVDKHITSIWSLYATRLSLDYTHYRKCFHYDYSDRVAPTTLSLLTKHLQKTVR